MARTRPDPPPAPTLEQVTTHVVVPYVYGMLRDETASAVMGWGGSYTFEQFAHDDPYAYARAVIGWWDLGLDLVVIEHDIVPGPGMIEGLIDCTGVWCAHPYAIGSGRTVAGLGLTKISRHLTARHPAAAHEALTVGSGPGGLVEWRSVDTYLRRKLNRLGHAEHLHYPEPRHLHYEDQAPHDG